MHKIDCAMPCLTGGTEGKRISVFCTTDTVQELQFLICDKIGTDNFYLLQNGRPLPGNGRIGQEPIQIILRTLGGKGGFGSMLRAIGAQIEKTTNREACRDLSGRRLRDINEEQRLKNWIAQQAARETEARDRKRMKLEKLLKEPSHNFEDLSYEVERSHLLERVADAFEQGVEAGPSSAPLKLSSTHSGEPSVTNGKAQKRKLENKNGGPKEKKSSLLWIDDLSCSEEDEESEEGSGCDETNKNETKDSGEAGTKIEANQQIVGSYANCS